MKNEYYYRRIDENRVIIFDDTFAISTTFDAIKKWYWEKLGEDIQTVYGRHMLIYAREHEYWARFDPPLEYFHS